MSNEFDAQEIFNPAQNDYLDYIEWEKFLQETSLTQEEVDAIPVDESYEDEEFRNDWYDDPIDYGE